MGDRIKGLQHIEIYVSNLKQSAQFWGWLLEKLGYRPYQQWDKGKSWKLADTYIVFVQTEKKYLDIPYYRKRVGLNHLAFHIDSIKELHDFRRELEDKEVQILYKEKKQNPNALYFEDPDRIKIELVVWNSQNDTLL